MRLFALAPGLLLVASFAVGIHLMQRSDDSVRQSLVQQSVATYLSTGQTCACPYSLDRMGRRCMGQRPSVRAGGVMVLCYPDDVTDTMVQAWRAIHR